MMHLEQETVESLGTLVERYGRTVGVDIELVLSQYEPLDVVQRVVGVGSVGTRCFLHLMAGADGDMLLLQVKEANESVLAKYGKVPQPPAHRGPGSRRRATGYRSSPCSGSCRACPTRTSDTCGRTTATSTSASSTT